MAGKPERTEPMPHDNQTYWNDHSPKYPHHVRQTEHITAGYARPEQFTTARHSSFLRVPLADCVLWGFSSGLYAQRFVDDFGGEIVPPLA